MEKLAEYLADQQREKTLRHIPGLRRAGSEIAAEEIRKNRSHDDDSGSQPEEQDTERPLHSRHPVIGVPPERFVVLRQSVAKGPTLHQFPPSFVVIPPGLGAKARSPAFSC